MVAPMASATSTQRASRTRKQGFSLKPKAETLMSATALKDDANRALQEGRPQEAISKYTEALKHATDEEKAVLHANKCLALMKVGRLEAAIVEGGLAIEADPTYDKGYYRLAKAQMEAWELAAAWETAARFPQLRVSIEEKRQSLPSIKQFELKDELGSGNYTTIYLSRRKIDNGIFALKIIEKAQIEKVKKRHENVANEVLMERRVLNTVQHPNIVRLFATFQDYYALYYCMELCEGGELWSRLVEGGTTVPTYASLARSWLAELCSAVSHLHSKGFVHRDLKPENMMLDAEGHLKLIDFGTAKDLNSPDLNGPEFCGTPEYMAPEMVDSQSADTRADSWAVGIVAFQLFTGTTPFRAKAPYFSFLKIRQAYLRLPACVALDSQLADFIQKLVKRDPQERPEIRGFEHPLLGSFAKIPLLKELCVRACAKVDTALDLDPLSRAQVMQYLVRTGKLADSFHLFYSPLDAVCLRADPLTRTYVGGEEGHFDKAFTVLVMGSPETVPVAFINRLRPPCVLTVGDLGDRQKYAALKVPMVFSPDGRPHYETEFGSRFFVYWCRGARFIVLDSVEDDDQQRFLDHELEVNALGSHRLFLVSKTSPFTGRSLDDAQKNWLIRLLKGRVDAWLVASDTEPFAWKFTSDDVTLPKKSEDSDDDNIADKFAVIGTPPVAGVIGADERRPGGLTFLTVYEHDYASEFKEV